MGTLDYLKEFEGRVLDAASYKSLLRNYELQEENNRLLKDKIEHLENELSILRGQNIQLSTENKGLSDKVKEFELKEHFKIHKGIFFKLNQNGKYDPTPYCPNCQHVMSNTGIGVYKCFNCEYLVKSKLNADTLADQLNSNAIDTKAK